MIAGGGQPLDLILDRIADAALRLTGASGAAVAMWKDGEVACRARAGETAPSLGARLSADSGISGACLTSGTLQQCDDTETDPRVDVEVCRDLGLRSIVALPIQAWREVNGILEVFSTRDHAFTDQHIALLQRLAVMAEWARGSEPRATSGFKRPIVVETKAVDAEPESGVRALAATLLANRRRTITWGSLGALAVLLIGLAVWLGWRGPKESVSSASGTQRPVAFQTPRPAGDSLASQSPIDSTSGKTSAGISVKLASKVERIAPEKKTSDSTAQGRTRPSPPSSLVVRPETKMPAAVETSEIQPPTVMPDASSSTLGSLLPSSASTPALTSMPISRFTNGYLLHHVDPKYPPQALQMRVAGKVILEAWIMEDGSVANLKVLEGQPALASAATAAVQQWRYKPYELNGTPVKMKTKITLDFRIP
jgi:TonB family protein